MVLLTVADESIATLPEIQHFRVQVHILITIGECNGYVHSKPSRDVLPDNHLQFLLPLGWATEVMTVHPTFYLDDGVSLALFSVLAADHIKYIVLDGLLI